MEPTSGVADVLANRKSWSIDTDDCLAWLRTIPAGSIHCCVTSPPYFNLRDYGHDEQIGSESTPDEFVQNLVLVFRRVRRALHDTGVLWLNLGDSYCNSGSSRNGEGLDGSRRGGATGPDGACGHKQYDPRRAWRDDGIKHKDLIGIPWMTAFALRNDGWYLRQWCPWVKRNGMPDSASDRPGTACETVFLLTKSPKYFFDMEAVKVPSVDPTRTRNDRIGGNKINETKHSDGAQYEGGETRQMRSADLWFDSVGMLMIDGQLVGMDVPIRGRSDAHFAIMPDRLADPMIRAGTSEKGVCPTCAEPWVRILEKERVATRPGTDTKVTGVTMTDGNRDPERHVTKTRTVGWEPGCSCGGDPIPAIVLDPFAGAGTTLAVARSRGRRAIGCELNPDHTAIIRRHLGKTRVGFF